MDRAAEDLGPVGNELAGIEGSISWRFVFSEVVANVVQKVVEISMIGTIRGADERSELCARGMQCEKLVIFSFFHLEGVFHGLAGAIGVRRFEIVFLKRRSCLEVKKIEIFIIVKILSSNIVAELILTQLGFQVKMECAELERWIEEYRQHCCVALRFRRHRCISGREYLTDFYHIHMGDLIG